MTNPMTYIGPCTVSIGDQQIGTVSQGIPVIKANIGRDMGYSEVRTPQTPECLHEWRQSWGSSGPICVCDKCGSWHHD